jgi:hypothetical protein
MTSPPFPLTTGAGPESVAETAALVRVIRRTYDARGYRALERFTVFNIHEFAHRLVAAGVRAHAVEDM